MIQSGQFLDECKSRGISLFTGTPCSYLKPFINSVIDDSSLEFIETTNEGDAVALACGARLGGRKSIVMFQNSGLGNAVNPLTSLSHTMQIPFIGIVTLRGEPGGPKDEPQHGLMGPITTKMLDLMEIPWAYFPTEVEKIKSALDQAELSCERTKTPYFFVMKKGSVQEYELKSIDDKRILKTYETPVHRLYENGRWYSRSEVLKELSQQFNDAGVLIATTGKTGRELFEIEDKRNNFYMVGSMGCALPIGVGLALSGYQENICVIDGDGALLMRLGNMALAGQIGPKKLIHILLDNGVHDSTGGQKSYSEHIDFAQIAKSCGYKTIYEIDSVSKLNELMGKIIASDGPSFIRFTISAGSPKDLGRPSLAPHEVTTRLQNYIKDCHERNPS